MFGGLENGICGDVSDLHSLCGWQGQVSGPFCCILLMLPACIFLEQTSHIQICVFVRPGLVSTSPTSVRSRANHTAALPQKR